jgi:GNAT superfamily N-acetyltransferase
VTVEIRLACADDAHDIADAHVTAWRVAYRGIVPDAFLDSEEFSSGRFNGWHRRLHKGRPDGWDDQDEIFAAVVDGRIVGFGHVGRERLDEVAEHGDATVGHGERGERGERGEVYGFYLHPDAWGSGAASALMVACEDALRQRFTTAILWVLRDNPRARRFYERSGWSCGAGADLVEAMWKGPQMADIPKLDPLAEVQYRREL